MAGIVFLDLLRRALRLSEKPLIEFFADGNDKVSAIIDLSIPLFNNFDDAVSIYIDHISIN